MNFKNYLKVNDWEIDLVLSKRKEKLVGKVSVNYLDSKNGVLNLNNEIGMGIMPIEYTSKGIAGFLFSDNIPIIYTNSGLFRIDEGEQDSERVEKHVNKGLLKTR